MPLIPAVSYQGAKHRIAPAICARFDFSDCPVFFDLCCGTGSVSIEVVTRGTYRPDQITMVDSGPWGLFWWLIGRRQFDIHRFREHVRQIPEDCRQIKAHMERLVAQPPSGNEAAYIFVILQAAAFGGKAVCFSGDGSWAPSSFRDYWQPTVTSSRRSPVNPMMPMPDSLFERVSALVEGMAGVTGIHGRVEDVSPPDNALIYIDPPYTGTTGYGDDLDVKTYVGRLKARCYVSEGSAISENAVLISVGRAKGGISGNRKRSANEEWLSIFNGGDRASAV